MAQRSNLSKNILDPDLKNSIDTHLLNNTTKEDSERGNSTSKLINAWRWKKIGLLALTFLFYGLYFYRKNKGRPNQNIFKVLFKLPTKRKIQQQISKDGGIKFTESAETTSEDVESSAEESEETKRRKAFVREQRVKKLRSSGADVTVEEESLKESTVEEDLSEEVVEKEDEQNEIRRQREAFLKQVEEQNTSSEEVVEQSAVEKDTSEEEVEQKDEQKEILSQRLRFFTPSEESSVDNQNIDEVSETREEVVDKGGADVSFGESVRFCKPISGDRFFIQKANGTFQVVDRNNKIEFLHVPSRKVHAVELTESDNYWYVAVNSDKSDARFILQFDKQDYSKKPGELYGITGDIETLSLSEDSLVVCVSENKMEDRYNFAGQLLGKGRIDPSAILKYPVNLGIEERQILTVNYELPEDNEATIDSEKYKFVAAKFKDEDERVILRYDQEDPVVPKWSVRVDCGKVNDLKIENDTLIVTGEDETLRLSENDFHYTVGTEDYVKTTYIQDQERKTIKAEFFEDKFEIPHTGHFVFLAGETFATRGKNTSEMQIWNPIIQPTQPINTLNEHTDEITCVAKIAGNLVTGSKDHTVIIWNTNEGRTEKMFVMPEETISALVVSDDNHYLVAASESGKVNIWDVRSGDLIKELDAGNKVISMDINEHGELSCVVAAKVDVEIPGETWVDQVKIWEVPELAAKLEQGMRRGL